MLLSALSLALLFLSLIELVLGSQDLSIILLLASMALTALSYVLSRSALSSEVPVLRTFVVSTELTCSKCGFKEERDFRRGDYVFKPAGKCPRCGGERVITSIFRREQPTQST